MKKFEIEVVEVLSRVIEVEAEDSDKAIDAVKKQYDNGEIILDSSDFDNMPVFQDVNVDNKCFNCQLIDGDK